MKQRQAAFALAGTLAVSSAAAALAQRRATSDDGYAAMNAPWDGRWVFARLRYSQGAGAGSGRGFRGRDLPWAHDYPRADRNLTTIVRELTAIAPTDGHVVVDIGNRELFRYPVAYMSEPGWWIMTDEEAENLRAWLLKGGFIIFDDFEGPGQLGNCIAQLRRVIPDARPVPLDASHPIFHSFFEIESLDFRHPYVPVQSEFLGVFEDNDPSRRLVAILNYNNDIGESWEFSDTGYFPVDLTNQAYKLGINYIVYALTR